jgi:putative glutamine amidotransferase
MRLVSGYFDSHFPFDMYDKIDELHATSKPQDLKEGDILLIWGGADISPKLYNKPVSRWCGADDKPDHRDLAEWTLMKRATFLGIPIIGICRGAQMLCAHAGGTLYQHIVGHPPGRHIVTTFDGREIPTNSLHHQMMNPFNVKHEMIASIKGNTRFHFDVDAQVPVTEEPEFVYFPDVKGFAIQWHPEMMEGECEATKFIFEQLDKRL